MDDDDNREQDRLAKYFEKRARRNRILEEFEGDTQFSRSRLIDEDVSMQQDLKTMKVIAHSVFIMLFLCCLMAEPVIFCLLYSLRPYSVGRGVPKVATWTSKKKTDCQRSRRRQTRETRVMIPPASPQQAYFYPCCQAVALPPAGSGRPHLSAGRK